MLKRIRTLVRENYQNHVLTHRLAHENIWAHTYHDSIRDNPELQNLSLKVGRWAGTYSFFYILHRILKEYEPEKIVEFGLGESSKFISTFNHSIGNKLEHITIEQDGNWKNIFNQQFEQNNIDIKVHPLQVKKHLEYEYNGYENIENVPTDADFYIVDGPFGSKRFSRYDIINVIQNFSQEKEFILILDDYQRIGEQDTSKEIIKTLKIKNIEINHRVYKGIQDQFVVATNKYKYSLSL